MNLRRFRIFGLLSLCLGLAAPPSQAANDLSQAGAILWEMGEIKSDFDLQRIARRITPEQVAALADKAARKLAKGRDELSELLPGLDAESRFARDLQRMLERWPDRQAFRDDLLPEFKAFELGRALAGLKFQAPDTRRGWTTPFPLFRP